MSIRLSRLPSLEGAQGRAADPDAHASLSASAGTGKTQVLTARVLRLLLKGAPPEFDLMPHLHQGRSSRNGKPDWRTTCCLGASSKAAP